ncbi:hypothetical protein [Rhizobium phage RHph_X2_26]|nr:hypothetical protein [Rhizobium phage RHph_X2_26]
MTGFVGFKYVFQCAHCGEDFGANRRDKRFCDLTCKGNAKEKRNPERARERSRVYREKNADAERERLREYNRTNRDRINRNKRIDRSINPEKYREWDAAWRAANPDKVREMRRKVTESGRKSEYRRASKNRGRQAAIAAVALNVARELLSI